MSMKGFFSVLTSFIFLLAPVSSSAMDKNDVGDECLVCLENVPEDKNEAITTPCGHKFCRDCLVGWLEYKKIQTEKEGWEFLPQCPKCDQYLSLDLYLENVKISECPICFVPKKLVTTDCDHKFCKDCIKTWTRKRNNCPLCRKENPKLIDDVSQIKEKVPGKELAEGGGEDELCPVCQCAFAGGVLTTTSCGHKFHNDCLNRWFSTLEPESRAKSCPLCRHSLETKCSICDGELSGDIIATNCGHKFCKNCLISRWKYYRRTYALCPKCRKEQSVDLYDSIMRFDLPSLYEVRENQPLRENVEIVRVYENNDSNAYSFSDRGVNSRTISNTDLTCLGPALAVLLTMLGVLASDLSSYELHDGITEDMGDSTSDDVESDSSNMYSEFPVLVDGGR